jgi:hypothetical protein
MKSPNLRPFSKNIRSTEVFIAIALKSFVAQSTGRMKITIWWQKNFHGMKYSKTKKCLMTDSPYYLRPENLTFTIRQPNPTSSWLRESLGTRGGLPTMLI